MNRLGQESSPYLLQHRDNPVDWFAWCEEAFEEARSRDVPVFLSIGYATCHWCHVMEHESFEDEEVAAILNESFVSIKVDREERPDIDHLYMSVCQIMGGSCGWPLTVLLTPDMRPFFVATYIPKRSRFGRIGMIDLVPRISHAWREDRERVEASASSITSAVRGIDTAISGSQEVDRDWLQDAFEQLAERYDSEYGGFGGAPKFPAPHNLLFLLRYWYRERNPEALHIVVHTLRRMRRGGVFDQVGFGFHRYSTDREWKLPHFEKMLYDQALHTMAYTEAYLATGEPDLADAAKDVAQYVLRDLTSEEGAFFSAEDADSEGEEGKFYVWSVDEVREVLPTDLADLVANTFELKPEGNFLDEATRELAGVNVLHRSVGTSVGAPDRARLEEARALLFEHRRHRPRPLLDDKVLTDWNGLMIAALSRVGAAVDEPRYIEAAARSAEFVWKELRDINGRLLHRYRAGQAGIEANLPDYACLLWGLIELYQATYDAKYLVRGVQTAEEMIARFWDDADGGFFMTPSDGEVLVARLKDFDDGAMPSGNSVALLCLLRLARLTGNTKFDEIASRLLESVAPRVARYPSGYSGLLMGLEFLEAGPTEVVVSGPTRWAAAREMTDALRRHYLPATVSVLLADDTVELNRVAPFTSAFEVDPDAAMAYVCRDYVCGRPSRTAEAMLAELGAVREDSVK